MSLRKICGTISVCGECLVRGLLIDDVPPPGERGAVA